MNTITLPELSLDTRSRSFLVDRLSALFAPQKEAADTRSDGIKDYSHIYVFPEFEARWWTDREYTRRCEELDVELYWLLHSEIRALQRVPDHFLTEIQRDWFTCAWAIIIGIETMYGNSP